MFMLIFYVDFIWGARRYHIIDQSNYKYYVQLTFYRFYTTKNNVTENIVVYGLYKHDLMTSFIYVMNGKRQIILNQ